MKRILALLSLILALCSVLCISSFAEGEEKERPSRVTDNAGLFTDEERSGLASAIYKAEEKSKCDYFIVTKVDTSSHIDKYYELTDAELLAAGIEKTGNNTVLLIIDRGNGKYEYRIFTHGNSYGYIDDGEFERIRSGIRKIESGDFMSGSSTWLNMSSEAYDQSVRTVTAVFVVFWVILTCAAVGITIGVVVGRYKMKIKPANYPLDRYARLELTGKEDFFRGTFVTRRRIPRSNGGGPGGRGGGGITGGGSRARG